jgi:two-component system chemotaxis sensor kinase CheA
MIEDLLASDPEILELFHEELASHCEAIELAALSVQSGGGRVESTAEGSSEGLRDLFRRLHTVKGSAYSVGFTEVGRLAHRVEDLVRSLLDSDGPPPALFGQALLRVVDELRRLGRDSALSLPAEFWSELDQKESRILAGTADEAAQGGGATLAAEQGGEGEASSLAVTDQVMVSIEALDELTLELERLRAQLERPDGDPGAQAGRAERIGRELLSIRQVPFGRLEGRLRRVVFDAAGELGKSVRFEIQGRENRIDAGLIDDLAVMLPHLLRNSLDHGLESVSQRIAAGKDPEGSLKLRCEMRQGEVRIIVEDDGRGVDGAAVLKRALERGVISAARAQELTHYERERLIFAPGFQRERRAVAFRGEGWGWISSRGWCSLVREKSICVRGSGRARDSS